MLNNEIATKAFAAVSSLPSNTYTVNVARETCKAKSEGIVDYSPGYLAARYVMDP